MRWWRIFDRFLHGAVCTLFTWISLQSQFLIFQCCFCFTYWFNVSAFAVCCCTLLCAIIVIVYAATLDTYHRRNTVCIAPSSTDTCKLKFTKLSERATFPSHSLCGGPSIVFQIYANNIKLRIVNGLCAGLFLFLCRLLSIIIIIIIVGAACANVSYMNVYECDGECVHMYRVCIAKRRVQRQTVNGVVSTLGFCNF